ncbi:MAG: indolepyruvate ferredoxin oxidoreductase, partial [Bacteroidaceae bacterium]|nr:indolepyruvate ferredoxin oxidoreductase [Bacteroidaceae bacterium]
MKKLLLGDQAIAQGALDAGLSGVYAYPGTPSTEITEYIQEWCKHHLTSSVHNRWCTNEKTAMEAALGMSYAGKRALVCMKHVGMNVCADAFVNSAVTGVNGGVIVLAADDPSMHSSQNEQDSRFYGKFALIPILEPSNQQECYDMMAYGFDLSERLRLPVLMRVVTRLAHSRAVVQISETARPENPLSDPADPAGWVLLPARARRKYNELIAAQPLLQESSANSPFNKVLKDLKDHKDLNDNKAVIAAGIGYNYLMENYPAGAPFPVLKLSQYPLPQQIINDLAAQYRELLVIEDGQPFIEEQLIGLLPTANVIHGRLDGTLPRAGELNPDNVKAALGLPSAQAFTPCDTVVGRPPALCQGC